MGKKPFENEEVHESYGMISWSRVTSSAGQVLFGSKSAHHQLVTLRVHRAIKCRDLSHDWYFPKETLIEVDMSPVQFAEFLTSPNYGSGVPCTLRQVGAEQMGDPEFVPDTVKFKNELGDDLAELKGMAHALKVKVDSLATTPGQIKKGEFKELAKGIDALLQHVLSNMPFVVETFTKAMSKTVVEAKAEVDAFIQHRIHETGLAALQSEAPQVLTFQEEEDDKE